MVSGMLVKAGVTVCSMMIFYKEVVQAVHLYWSEIWVIMDYMMKVMEGFHHHIAWRILGKISWSIGERWMGLPPRGGGSGGGKTVAHTGVRQEETIHH